MWSCARRISRVFEDAKVDRFLVWLYAPGYRVSRGNIHPPHEVRLASISNGDLSILWVTYFAMHLDILHSRHSCRILLCSLYVLVVAESLSKAICTRGWR